MGKKEEEKKENRKEEEKKEEVGVRGVNRLYYKQADKIISDLQHCIIIMKIWERKVQRGREILKEREEKTDAKRKS